MLLAEELRPSTVATQHRSVTQAQALRLFERHRNAAGLCWGSILEASWIHVTLFDRALPALTVRDVRALAVDDPPVAAAAAHLGLA